MKWHLQKLTLVILYLQRKLLISKKIDPEDIRTEPIETPPEPPPKFLTPRAPVIEEEPPQPKTPKGVRRVKLGSKSEMNLSTLSKQTSGSSIGSFANHAVTSTPKQYGHGYGQSHSQLRSYGVDHQRGLSQSSSGSDSRSSHQAPEPASQTPVYATIRPSTSAYSLQQRAAEYNGYERDRGGYPDRSSLGYTVGSVGQRPSGGVGHPSQLPPAHHKHSEEDPYTPMSRGPRQNGGGSHSLPRPGHSGTHGYMSMEGAKRPTISPPGPPREARGDGYGDGQHNTPSSRQHQPEGSDHQYMPGNVRNLVQNFHMSVQPSATGNGNTPHQPPVPPPRRSRPLSAGGNLGSGMSGNSMGGNGSAFTTPRPQSAIPSGYGGGGSHHMTGGNNNNNNFTPESSDKSLARPGSTPPRPSPAGREGVPKSALWYEYGCV